MADNQEVALRRMEGEVAVPTKDIEGLFTRVLDSVRDDLRDSPYIIEALRVLPVGGFRSAIGSFWNAVVDDLRQKIIYRSLPLFNKSVDIGREIKTYEDFQNYVNDDQLIEGAYRIGVIGWEASKVLRHAKETRHIFSGHPKSSDPSPIKVLAMMEDSIKYVLSDGFPPPIIDLDDYVAQLGEQTFDRNEIGVENALGDLPEIYQNELINRLFTVYVHPASSSTLRSNIEFVLPILWRVLPKEVRRQVVRRVDQTIPKGDSASIEQAFAFVQVVNATPYLSTVARRYHLTPLIEGLESALDDWSNENRLVRELAPYAAIIPSELLLRYVGSLTKTYVGYTGYSGQYSRRDFYANGAALVIPGMFETFDDRAAEAFITIVRTDSILQERIKRPAKMKRLRSLGHIVSNRVSESFSEQEFLDKLLDEGSEEKLWKEIERGASESPRKRATRVR